LTLDAIYTSASSHYSVEQLRAWAARCTLEGHRLMIERTTVLVAEVDGVTAGFANLAIEIHELDQLYVAPWAEGRGAARLLVEAIEGKAVDVGLKEIEARASWRAIEVFDRAGWEPSSTYLVVVGRSHVAPAAHRAAQPARYRCAPDRPAPAPAPRAVAVRAQRRLAPQHRLDHLVDQRPVHRLGLVDGQHRLGRQRRLHRQHRLTGSIACLGSMFSIASVGSVGSIASINSAGQVGAVNGVPVLEHLLRTLALIS